MQLVFRFVVGGLIVSAFASFGDVVKPKSFAGLFAAAPSVALATLGLTIATDGKLYVAAEGRSMIAGAIALFLCAAVTMRLIMKYRLYAGPAAICAHRRVVRLRYGSLARDVAIDAMIIQFDFSALKKTKWYEYALRFLFGGVMTVTAGMLAAWYGPAFGGLFLAFPAIFPASATLIEKHEKERKERAGILQTARGQQAAALDARGAAMGSVGLAGFAFAVWKLAPIWNGPLTLFAALVVWLALSILIWRVRRHRLFFQLRAR